jgi:phenylalanyl-tRNA synthetase beta chain
MRRMGYGASVRGHDVDILVPAYRSDILHTVDLAEDAAIGYGFENFGQSLPRMATFGTEDPLISYAQAVKTMMVGLGYSEVVTLSLSSPEEQFDAMNLPRDRRAIVVLNPVSEAHVLLRESLIPSLMNILRKNKHRDLPQRIFEVGDVIAEGRNRTMLSGVAAHPKASFTEAKSTVQGIVAGLAFGPSVEAREHPGFISGRCAEVGAAGEAVGVFGELTPATIEAFELRHPVIAFELDLERLFSLALARERSS